jgi:hypothetical protein
MENIEQLAAQWLAAKTAENAARDGRLEVEAAIVEITGLRDEGSKTHEAGQYKISVTSSMTRTLDPEKWAEIEASIPEAMRPVIYKPSLELKGLRYLQQNEPDTYAIVAQAITAKHAKPSIKITEN